MNIQRIALHIAIAYYGANMAEGQINLEVKQNPAGFSHIDRKFDIKNQLLYIYSTWDVWIGSEVLDDFSDASLSNLFRAIDTSSGEEINHAEMTAVTTFRVWIALGHTTSLETLKTNYVNDPRDESFNVEYFWWD